MTKQPLSTDEVRQLATAYALECKAEKRRPTMAEMSRRLGKHTRWLTARAGQSIKSEVVRAEVVKAWIQVGTPPAVLPPPSDGNTDDLVPPAMPETPIKGEALHTVLSDPGCLRQFCSLSESFGIETALRYAQQWWERVYAPKESAR
jgi:hypothetical protein